MTVAVDARREPLLPWWLFLVMGIGWLIFAWIVLSLDFTTVWAVAIWAGCGLMAAGEETARRFRLIPGGGQEIEINGIALVPKAAAAGVRVEDMAGYYGFGGGRPGLVIGYGAIAPGRIAEGV